MIEIISYNDTYAADFKKLNMEWLLKYHVLEQYDIDVLNHPHEKILDGGGYIFLAKTSDGIVGSAGLRKENSTTYEVVKMAVTQLYQGKGISKQLMDTCMATAKANKAEKLILYSNSSLKTAISLYSKYGFTHVNVVNSPLKTVDVKMELVL